MNQKLWNKVESALVGGVYDALLALTESTASGEYSAQELQVVAQELLQAITEVRAIG